MHLSEDETARKRISKKIFCKQFRGWICRPLMVSTGSAESAPGITFLAQVTMNLNQSKTTDDLAGSPCSSLCLGCFVGLDIIDVVETARFFFGHATTKFGWCSTCIFRSPVVIVFPNPRAFCGSPLDSSSRRSWMQAVFIPL